jgi:hypothetical protein
MKSVKMLFSLAFLVAVAVLAVSGTVSAHTHTSLLSAAVGTKTSEVPIPACGWGPDNPCPGTPSCTSCDYLDGWANIWCVLQYCDRPMHKKVAPTVLNQPAKPKVKQVAECVQTPSPVCWPDIPGGNKTY